jgi:formyl-CoA transferase
MEKLGCGWDVLHTINPRLVYVAISGFGHIDVMPSPFSHRPAFDVMGQALAGLMNRPERQGDKPVYLGFSLADIQGGILGAYGAMLALFQRSISGVGRKVDISLYDACLALNEISITMYSVTRERAMPGVHAISAPFGSYKAADGYIVIAVLGEHIWKRFCNTLGQPDLLLDEGFKDGVSRQRNLLRLDKCINQWLSGLTRADAVAALLANGVPASTVNDIDDIFDCPHVAARKMLVQLNDPSWGQVAVAGNPVKLSGIQERKPIHPPDLGTHTEEVLQGWLGVDEKQVADWRAAGCLGSSK